MKKIRNVFGSLTIVLSLGLAMPGFAAAEEPIEEPDYSPWMTESQIYYESIGEDHPLDPLIDAEDNEGVIETAGRLMETFPDDEYIIAARAYAYFQLEDFDNSVDDALKIICRGKYSDVTQYILQTLLDYKPEIVRDHLKSLTVGYLADPDPKNACECLRDYLLMQSYVDKKLFEMEEAFQCAKAAAQLPKPYSGDTDAEIQMASIYLNNDYNDKAIELLRPFMGNKDDLTPSLLQGYTLALTHSGRNKEAYDLYEKLLKSKEFSKDEKLYLQTVYAVTLANAGEYAKALKLFDNVIKEKEKNFETMKSEAFVRNELAELYLRRGIIYMSTGKKDKGIDQIKKSLEIQPEYSSLELTSYAWLGDREKLMEAKSKYDLGSYPVTEASLYAVLGDNAKAIELLEKAFSLHDSSPTYVENDLNFRELVKTPEYRNLKSNYRPLPLD